MPFIGRDWRSPGEAWVKTESLGWQRMKIIESQLYSSSVCHQNPACSWPPKSEFGQHMANNCNRTGRNSSEFNRDSISSVGSSDSGRGGSMSPSPTRTPEKNVHHIHPIIISSPYGQYSCCSHHFESGWSPKTNSNNNNCCESKNDNHNHLSAHAQTMSRSLSRESVTLDTSTNKMCYNDSIADFRNSSSPSSSSSPLPSTPSGLPNSSEDPSSRNSEDIEKNLHQQPTDKDCANSDSPSTPTLMKNGFKIDDEELLGSCEQLDSSVQNNKMADKNSKNQQQSQDNASQHTSGTCCCANSQSIQGLYYPKEPIARTAPHCRISVRTREVAMYNTISEAFYRLDFCNAIHDIRRFNYICKLLHLLITQNLTSLSGCATKVLFTMLEQVAWEGKLNLKLFLLINKLTEVSRQRSIIDYVSSNKRNIHVLKNLLNELRQMIQKYYCWGRPIGSSLLWQQHFDTIERISRIVDGIELSPPKNDTAQPTFNNLPVEMIREILLRLNDYRDLVNSAQASPVMRTMIDNQHIWQKLCRYHFTEQQLKLALEDNKGLFVKKGNSRGVKYARTSSADGRTSFRNPVAHRSKSVSTTRQQIEQASGRRGSRQLDKNNSYVTKAIRIFDKQGSSTTLGSTRVRNNESENSRRGLRNSNDDSNGPSQKSRLNTVQGNVSLENRPLNSSRPSHEIDWERVFHQLRKKFDLKEEYADCLLLCRHCRCLFWKSFGHPCIKNDDSPRDRNYPNIKPDRQRSEAGGSSSAQNARNCDGSNRQSVIASQGQQQNSRQQSSHDHSQSRVSVAALSRNFDNRAQGIRRAVDAAENVPPESSALNSQSAAQQPSSQRLLNNGNALDARLRERNVRIANRIREDNSRNNNNDNNGNGNNVSARATVRRDELVPKHVAISPQAFLKFFSL